ncbi:MAG: linear amide C-N hydrolase [Candidatus Margulisbacteria bacterium]|nr:linear amide C-N hydrolase [Candidatus Margulisiibacteriota bacterium]
MPARKMIPLFLLAALFLSPNLTFACTDFRVKATDGTVVIGRSMEFPLDLQSEICVVPRQPGKYGFIALNAFGLKTAYVDGFNEKGLSLDGLMYTGAVYEPAGTGRDLPLDSFGAWALGNFATVAEVKAALPTVNIIPPKNPKLKNFGIHLAVHDAAGQSVVIEFIDGQKRTYDNPLGVLTNRPSFDWQLANLRNYVNLNSLDVESKTINGVKVEAAGVGSGLRGLPGDWTPPSRFVKIALSLDAALPPKNAVGAVNLAEHLLNSIDIPKGAIKEPTAIPGQYLYGYAQWAVIKDLTNRVLYYRTYDKTAWQTVDLNKFDLGAGKEIKAWQL